MKPSRVVSIPNAFTVYYVMDGRDQFLNEMRVIIPETCSPSIPYFQKWITAQITTPCRVVSFSELSAFILEPE